MPRAPAVIDIGADERLRESAVREVAPIGRRAVKRAYGGDAVPTVVP